MPGRKLTEKQLSSVRPNTIGMGRAEVKELLERMSTSGQSVGVDEFRSFMRWPLMGVTAQFQLEENSRFRDKQSLTVRNISNSGISLLHSAFFYPGTRCRITLPLRDDPSNSGTYDGVIIRCIHVEGVVHEIGIKFDRLIDSSKFVSKLVTLKSRPEITKPKNLNGRVLHVDSSPVDRRLIEFFLSNSNVQLSVAESFKEARTLAKEPFDMILCEMMMPDGDGAAFIRWLRDQCIDTPVAIHSATHSSQARDSIENLEVQGFLPKPIDRTTLITAMTEFLSLPRSEESSEHSLALDLSNPTVIQIVDLFKKEIDLLIDTLGDDSAREDAMQLYSVVLRLQGTAPTLGFEQLGKVAARAAESLAATMSSEESAPQLNALIESCKAARAA